LKVGHGSRRRTAFCKDVYVEGVEQMKPHAATPRFFGGGDLQRGHRWIGEVRRSHDGTVRRSPCDQHSAGCVTDDVECRGSWPDDDYTRAFLFCRVAGPFDNELFRTRVQVPFTERRRVDGVEELAQLACTDPDNVRSSPDSVLSRRRRTPHAFLRAREPTGPQYCERASATSEGVEVADRIVPELKVLNSEVVSTNLPADKEARRRELFGEHSRSDSCRPLRVPACAHPVSGTRAGGTSSHLSQQW
jgi:hypothetical protein